MTTRPWLHPVELLRNVKYPLCRKGTKDGIDRRRLAGRRLTVSGSSVHGTGAGSADRQRGGYWCASVTVANVTVRNLKIGVDKSI